MSIHDMDRFEEKEMMKKRPNVKNPWYNFLIDYILKPIKNWVVLKTKLWVFKTNTTKNYKPKRASNVYEGGKKPRKPNIEKQSENNVNKYVKKIF